MQARFRRLVVARPDDAELAAARACAVYDGATSLASRADAVPTLLVRGACVEDHDDLVPIFDAQSEVLSERYVRFDTADAAEP